MPAKSIFPARSLNKTVVSSMQGKPPLGFYARLLSIWLSLSGYRWALIVVIAVAWLLRAHNPYFSSAYMDESIYVLYGRMFLAHRFEPPIDQPLHFSFGWYLWPILAAWADRIWGLVGVREVAAALGTLTVWSVYAFARRLFSPAVGLASATVFVFLGPAVLASRIATRDIGSIFFFALGLWLFVRAWQEQEWPSWLAASFSMFAAFLCKYLIAIYFPFLVILTLWKGRRAILGFSLSLALLCAGYGFFERDSLLALLQYGHAYNALRAPASAALQIYFTHRLDFWLLVALSFFAWERGEDYSRGRVALLCVGAAVILFFQLFSRADYDYWKHVNYSFLFLVPIAMYGLLRVIRSVAPASYTLTGAVLVTLLASGLGWMGNAWRIDRFLFWPNAEPAAAYFEGRLASDDRILVDDTVFRYYFSPPLHQWQIVDPFYFRYGNDTGAAAYAAAVRDGWFDYLVLDGGIGDDAKRLRAAVVPEVSARYALRVSTPDPVVGQPIEIYERENPPAAKWESSRPQIEITAPASGALVRTINKATTLSATVRGIRASDYALVDVFTNRWYRQGGEIRPGIRDGEFSQTIYLAGEGREQCYHIVRVRVFDLHDRFLSSAMNFNVARANPDGSHSCR
ncbi:MAG TPA: glycosyltransferase family 39 protein [Candidatus Acidoferrales bacterium]|nr:glycosyltransferase family 39 protein [Candidatus Acidoferrales bacterium]